LESKGEIEIVASQKEMLDVVLVNRGLYTSRERAKSAIMAGLIVVNGERIDKSGMKIPVDADIYIKGDLHPYVSRGGLKLEQALREFQYDMKDKVVIDIGASTGGFSDCALQHGAAHVYAVDVGYGQLAWSLRQDPRVTVMERTNFRYLKPDDLNGPLPDVAVMDVSFISIRLLFPVIHEVLKQQGTLLTLIKPQFEAGREKVGKQGIVRDAQTHREVLHNVLTQARNEGFELAGLTYSPIAGGDGNIEFLAKLDRIESVPEWDEELEEQFQQQIMDVVDRAHLLVGKKNSDESL
jgi:23S rRNA (cytidine1920-2'-O)/16S rRNA (cytidine1409-2'-O)-methyltransferase